MKKFITLGFVSLLFPITLFAQVRATSSATTGVAAAQVTAEVNPGLVPGDFFYFLDNWGESIRALFTFNAEAKARLHIEYAKERAAEIKAVLADPNAKIDIVVGAKVNFDQQVAQAAAIIKSEKSKGTDVAELASDLSNELDMSHVELSDTLHVHKERANQAEINIRAKLAALSTDDPERAGLTQALASITKEKEDSVTTQESIDATISDNQGIFDEAMGPKEAAKKHIEQALRLRAWMGKDGEFGADTSRNYSTTSVELMIRAQEALKAGDFENAKDISEQAKHQLEIDQESSLKVDGRERGLPSLDLNVNGQINVNDSGSSN